MCFLIRPPRRACVHRRPPQPNDNPKRSQSPKRSHVRLHITKTTLPNTFHPIGPAFTAGRLNPTKSPKTLTIPQTFTPSATHHLPFIHQIPHPNHHSTHSRKPPEIVWLNPNKTTVSRQWSTVKYVEPYPKFMTIPFPNTGIIAALHLPHDKDGKLVTHALKTHMNWLKSCDIHGFLALGSSGNFPFLSLQQRIEALTQVRNFAGDLPVIGNVSDINPDMTRALATAAKDLDLSGIALMPPFFYPSSNEDQIAFFLEIANLEPNLPLLLYNFPELAGNRINLRTVSEVADSCNLKGFKQSGSEFPYHQQLVSLGEQKGFSVFSGADTRLPEVFSIGAKGCIGGLVNIVPELMLSQYREAFGAEADPESQTTSLRMQNVGKILSKLNFPLNIAAGIEARGFAPGKSFSIRSEHSRELHGVIAKELRELFQKWNLPLGPF